MEPIEKKVIIFDDDEDILSICQFILEDSGRKVFTFSDCDNIVENVRSINPSIILMDNWIPERGGIAATKILKNTELSHIPVIYFSANSDIAALAEEAGAESYLAKPFDLEKLLSVIDQFER